MMNITAIKQLHKVALVCLLVHLPCAYAETLVKNANKSRKFS